MTSPHLSISISTFANPMFTIPISFAAEYDMSIILPSIKGPLSFIFTTTDRLFSMLVTLAIVPRGISLWAAVLLYISYISPLHLPSQQWLQHQQPYRYPLCLSILHLVCCVL